MIEGTPKYPNCLRQTIDKCHLTVEEVAAETEIPKRTLFDYCAGRVRIPIKRLEVLADYLGYPASYLVPSIENPYLVQSEKRYIDVWMQPGVINNVDKLRRRLLQQ